MVLLQQLRRVSMTGVATAQYRLGWLVVLHYTGYTGATLPRELLTTGGLLHPPDTLPTPHSYTDQLILGGM